MSNIISNDDDPNFIPIANNPTFSEGPVRHRRRRRHPPIPVYNHKVMETPIPEVTDEERDSLLLLEEDWYTNPLVSHKLVDSNMIGSDLDQLIASTNNIMAQDTSPISVPVTQVTFDALSARRAFLGVGPSLLRDSVSQQNAPVYTGDPFSYQGKVTKFGRVYAENVTVIQNTNWVGAIDVYEEGRLLGFQITCNDPDMIVNCSIENGAGTTEVINDMSYRQMVQHGMGMTYEQANAIVPTQGGSFISTGINGMPSQLWPYVMRYKDQYTGSGIYSEIKNTVDDKAYVMIYEPTVSIPYQRFTFNVFNGSVFGDRLINRLVIRRMIYVDPDPVPPTTVIPTDLEQLSQTLVTLQNNPDQLHDAVTSRVAGMAKTVDEKLFEEFQEFLNQKKQKQLTNSYSARSVYDQGKAAKLREMLGGSAEESPRGQDKRVLNISWD